MPSAAPAAAPPVALCRRATVQPAQDTAAPAPGDAAERTIEVAAAFCRSDTPATAVIGRVDGVSGPTDPAFVGLIRQVTFELFPPDEEDRLDDDDCPFFLGSAC